jgi:HEAT repeat protein
MSHLSDHTNVLLGQLYSRRGVFSRLTGASDAERVRLVGEVAESREPAAAIPLTRLLFDDSAPVAAAASDAIHQLLSAASPEDLIALDEHMRWESWDWSSRWQQLRPDEVSALPRTEASRTSVLGLVSFHRSGYVRERAVRLLAAAPAGAGLPYLLIRLNDWVANVRSAARQAVEKCLGAGSPGLLLGNLALVVRLADCRRTDHADLVGALLRRLTVPEYLPDLLGVVRSGQQSVARACFRLLADLPGPHLPALVQAGLQARDAVVRLWAIRHLPTTEGGARLGEALSARESDGSLAVRREALRVRLQALPETAEPALERALLDRSPSVREFARFHLARVRPADFPAFYRNVLSARAHVPQAIAGLGETGTRADAPSLVPFLTAPDRRTRQAAVRAVGTLAGDEYAGLLAERLTDEGPKVVREARQALQGQADALGPERLWAIFTGGRRRHVRVAALALIDHTGTWGKLPYLIRAAADPDEAIALQARGCVERRYNRVFTRPTEEQRVRIAAALEECASSLPPPFLAGLRAHVRG